MMKRLLIISLVILSGCQRQKPPLISPAVQKQLTSKRLSKAETKRIQKAQKQYDVACQDHADAFYIVENFQGDKDNELKKIIFSTNKAWGEKYWSLERWFGVGINEYHSLPFITYHKNLKKHRENLKKWELFLKKRDYDTDSLLNDISAISLKLQALLDLTENHDRYLQEKDKLESMHMTKQMYSSLMWK